MGEVRVIDFKAKPFSETKGRDKFCEHNRILIDEKERKLECKDCNRVLDPIDYLISIANKENSMWERYCSYDKEVDRLKKRYSNLNKEIERLKRVREKLKHQ